MDLPVQFTTYMKQLLGDEYEAYLDSFLQSRSFGMRCNTTKISPEEWRKLSPFALRGIPWISNGFFYEEEDRPSKDPYYYAGLYYLQEPSAMTPAAMLPVEQGDAVLDICAAPGGKSTELAAKLHGTGFLLSNDISNSRARALLKNLEMAGAANICVTSEEPKKLAAAFPEFFDKILIDAPCSGEGMFRKDTGLIKSFLEHGPEYYAPIQKEITEEAVSMLRPGGMLLYSTCTFAEMEDEAVILELLRKHPELKLVPLPTFEGACDGIGLSGCIRLFPHKIEGEGHFMALMRKDEDTQGHAKPQKAMILKAPACPTCVLEFLSACHTVWDPQRFFINKEQIYYLPERFDVSVKLRYLRTGLYLGDVKKGRFEPSQALAMTLSPDTYEQVLCLEHEDDRTIRYLKGETLALKDDELSDCKGWCLVCVDRFPLGWAKVSGRSLKNKYYPGWRWQ